VNLIPTPTTLTASFAGAFAGLVMPVFWTRFGNDTTTLVVSFLLVVAFPAHAFVVGFRREEADAGLVKRVVAWLGAAIVTMAVTRMGGA
jgi:hypothetical protein